MLKEYVNLLDEPKWECFSRELKPLSLGHIFLLESINSPLIQSPEKSELADFLLAVWICSFSYNVAIEKVKAENIGEMIFDWGMEWGEKELEAITQIKIWNEYLKHYLTSPKRWKTEKSGDSSSTPWMLFLVLFLQKELGITENQAWNMPCNRAFAYFACVNEKWNGDENYITEDEENAKQTLEELLRNTETKTL
jgi:hypothetical protein